MQMIALAEGLRGQALLAHRVKDLLYGESVTIRVEIDPNFKASSLIIPVHILQDIVAARDLLAGSTATALANLATLLGFFGLSGASLYHLFRLLKGRRIEKPEDVPRHLKINIEIDLLIRIYNNPEVQTFLRKVLDPLHQDGIEEFQTIRQGVVIESVHKADLLAADAAELEALTKNEERDLGIEKSAWRRSLAWHLRDGETSFDARIEDEAFWKRIEGGEAFADGDRLRVHLQTTARRTRFGTLKVERIIPEVIEVEHVRRKQMVLFEGNE